MHLHTFLGASPNLKHSGGFLRLVVATHCDLDLSEDGALATFLIRPIESHLRLIGLIGNLSLPISSLKAIGATQHDN